MKVQLKEIDSSAILTALKNLDYKELERVQDEIKYYKSRLLRVGSNVSFERSRDGSRLYGVIHKINPKSIGIDTDNEGRWKVSKSLVRLEG